jgi:DNA-binding FadR family transcriptional regulator
LLARRVIESDRSGSIISFPREADLCAELGVSRSILRESMKVLVDKGMIEMNPRAGTRSKRREGWRLLDPDILAWQAESGADPQFLRDLCEVRLAIEPTAAGFAAVRATNAEIRNIEGLLEQRRSAPIKPAGDRQIDLDLEFQSAIVAASHNPMLVQLSNSISRPFRLALAYASRHPASVRLSLQAHETLLESLRKRDALAARRAAEEVVGFAMIAVEEALKTSERKERKGKT